MDIGRQADLEYLTEQLKGAVGFKRRMIEENIRKICNENGLVRSMRERLIKEARNGHSANVRDINEYIKGKTRYE